MIPALNEAGRLPDTLAKLQDYLTARPFSAEVIVVSNGSTDGTDALVLQVAAEFPQLHLITLQERGKGLATRAGALASRGEVIFLCDADLSMPAHAIDDFLNAISDVDVVVGSREAAGARRFNEPAHRHLMGRVFNKLVQFLAVPGIEDTQCGFKAFRRRVADDVFPSQTLHGFAFDVEVLYLARKFGYTMRELPIDWYFNNDTRVRPGVDSLQMFGEVLLLRWRSLTGHYRCSHPTPARSEDIV